MEKTYKFLLMLSLHLTTYAGHCRPSQSIGMLAYAYLASDSSDNFILIDLTAWCYCLMHRSVTFYSQEALGIRAL